MAERGGSGPESDRDGEVRASFPGLEFDDGSAAGTGRPARWWQRGKRRQERGVEAAEAARGARADEARRRVDAAAGEPGMARPQSSRLDDALLFSDGPPLDSAGPPGSRIGAEMGEAFLAGGLRGDWRGRGLHDEAGLAAVESGVPEIVVPEWVRDRSAELMHQIEDLATGTSLRTSDGKAFARSVPVGLELGARSRMQLRAAMWEALGMDDDVSSADYTHRSHKARSKVRRERSFRKVLPWALAEEAAVQIAEQVMELKSLNLATYEEYVYAVQRSAGVPHADHLAVVERVAVDKKGNRNLLSMDVVVTPGKAFFEDDQDPDDPLLVVGPQVKEWLDRRDYRMYTAGPEARPYDEHHDAPRDFQAAMGEAGVRMAPRLDEYGGIEADNPASGYYGLPAMNETAAWAQPRKRAGALPSAAASPPAVESVVAPSSVPVASVSRSPAAAPLPPMALRVPQIPEQAPVVNRPESQPESQRYPMPDVLRPREAVESHGSASLGAKRDHGINTTAMLVEPAKSRYGVGDASGASPAESARISALALQTINHELDQPSFGHREDRMRAAFAVASNAVRAERNNPTKGTSATAGVVELSERHGDVREALIAHMGKVRVYVARHSGQLELVTLDDIQSNTKVTETVARNLQQRMNRITSEAELHGFTLDQQNFFTSYTSPAVLLGDAIVSPKIERATLHMGDALIVVTEGSNSLSHTEIGAAAAGAMNASEMALAITRQAKQRSLVPGNIRAHDDPISTVVYIMGREPKPGSSASILPPSPPSRPAAAEGLLPSDAPDTGSLSVKAAESGARSDGTERGSGRREYEPFMVEGARAKELITDILQVRATMDLTEQYRRLQEMRPSILQFLMETVSRKEDRTSYDAAEVLMSYNEIVKSVNKAVETANRRSPESSAEQSAPVEVIEAEVLEGERATAGRLTSDLTDLMGRYKNDLSERGRRLDSLYDYYERWVRNTNDKEAGRTTPDDARALEELATAFRDARLRQEADLAQRGETHSNIQEAVVVDEGEARSAVAGLPRIGEYVGRVSSVRSTLEANPDGALSQLDEIVYQFNDAYEVWRIAHPNGGEPESFKEELKRFNEIVGSARREARALIADRQRSEDDARRAQPEYRARER